MLNQKVGIYKSNGIFMYKTTFLILNAKINNKDS